MTDDGITTKEYLDARCSGIELQLRTTEKHLGERIEALSDYVCDHFEIEEETREVWEKRATETLKLIDTRVKELELAKSFSAGKMWMMMAILASIPTILAIIALFRG